MKAEATAPATTRLNSASGIRKAAQNASSCGVSPNVAPKTERRSHPRIRLAMSAAIMTRDARAMDIVTGRVWASAPRAIRLCKGRRVSFRPYGKEEALGTQAHPSDAAAHHHQDRRALGRAKRGEGRAHSDREGRRDGPGGRRRGREHARPRGEARRGPQERGAP